jgi:dGTPase
MAKMYNAADYDRLKPLTESPSLGPEPYRSDFRRDYARILHAPSFRRLQGKTQLFPGQESDFFRNRLTHSLEVAQIAESIVEKLNYEIRQQYAPEIAENYLIDSHLVRLACLAHDLGHPPFGHLGEEVLNKKMREAGGFEGNAQTLHILTKLEKRDYVEDNWLGVQNDKDYRLGLNLTFRSLASVLKYDTPIKHKQAKGDNSRVLKPPKGYYACEKDLVAIIKNKVAPGYTGPFKTVECAIMDVADDIAYSTYDLEDALKAGFITPLSIISTPIELWDDIVIKVNESLAKEHAAHGWTDELKQVQRDEAIHLMYEIFSQYLATDEVAGQSEAEVKLRVWKDSYLGSETVARNSAIRVKLTSHLVGMYIRAVKFELNEEFPSMSKVYLNPLERTHVEILKQFTWQYQILSLRLKIAARRGVEIVSRLFDIYKEPGGCDLLPTELKKIYDQLSDPDDKRRVICDLIAGMTDKHAIELYGRLTSERPETIFKPF